jgi:hypothetical protein
MHVYGIYLATLHQLDLLEEARLDHRAKLTKASQPNVPAWRRGLGGSARSLSGVLASVARSLDPSVESERTAGRRSEGGVGRALAS